MTQLLATRDRISTVRGLLEKSKAQIALALPRHMSAERMMRIALTSIQRNPALLECDPISLIGAVIQSSQLGLEPDGVLGQAYLIPYRNSRKGTREVQFQPGYLGLLALARRSGDIDSVDTRVVYERDRFKYAFGLTPVLEHVPSTEEDRGAATYVYAIVRLKDGGAQFDVMSVGEIEAHRKRYSRASADGPWVTAFEAMAKKTVLKRVLKLAPASVELQRAIALDEHAEAGLPQDLDAVATAEFGAAMTNGQEAPKALDRLADALEEKAAPMAVEEAEDPADPRADLVRAITAERGKLEKPIPEASWAALCKAQCGTDLLATVDAAALVDFLAFVTALVAKDAAAVARARQILGAGK